LQTQRLKIFLVHTLINGKAVSLMTAGDFKVKSIAVDGTKHAILNVDDLGNVSLDDVIKVL
jgi:hypothetical protein